MKAAANPQTPVLSNGPQDVELLRAPKAEKDKYWSWHLMPETPTPLPWKQDKTLTLFHRSPSNGDGESAIVGGANLMISLDMTIAMTKQGVISPNSASKSFHAVDDGSAPGRAVHALGNSFVGLGISMNDGHSVYFSQSRSGHQETNI
jgi:hypothetical protein